MAPLTANERLRNRSILHAHDLELLKNSEALRVVRFLNSDLRPALLQSIERALLDLESTGGLATASRERVLALGRLEALRRELDQTAARYFEAIERDQTGDRLARVARFEAAHEAAGINAAVPRSIQDRLGITVTLPPPETIRRILDVEPMQGAPIREWWNEAARSLASEAHRTIQIGVTEGRATREIARDVMGTKSAAAGPWGKTLRGSEAIVRTSVNHVSTSVREATYQSNEEVVKGVLIVATLDTRTTPICRDEDGNFYELGVGGRPPFHVNCRTTTVPVLKTLSEMGVTKADQAALPETTRASLTGPVPSKTTYYEWLRRQPKAAQVRVLGETRARLWREGKITPDQFVNDRGRFLTLKELEAKGVPVGL